MNARAIETDARDHDLAAEEEAIAVCRMVDDFARLPPAEFREKYGIATLGAGWDQLTALARRVVQATEGVPR